MTTTGNAQRGFSFIEILIVMGIISVLVGGVIVAINMWAEKGPQFATKNTVTKVKALIEDWKRVYEFYPPSTVTRIPAVTGTPIKVAVPENKVNEGIEAVYQALYWPGFKSDPAWEETQLGNTDEDKLRKAINKHGTPELKEIVDAWQNPLIYFHRDDYMRYAESGASYLNYELNDVQPTPYKNEDGTFVNPGSFQIFSMGPDGEPNTDDDITPWSRK